VTIVKFATEREVGECIFIVSKNDIIFLDKKKTRQQLIIMVVDMRTAKSDFNLGAISPASVH